MPVINPHFDEGLVVWSDEYSGRYQPPQNGYSEQFELQWKLALQGIDGYFDNPGASTEDEYINDRVLEWTGKRPGGEQSHTFRDGSMGVRVLDKPVPVELISGKKCIDIGCGLGRWTRVMQALGAESVLSVDMSESALRSVSAFTTSVAKADITAIPESHPDWSEAFDFANFWGVAMCTHDPLKAFMSAASTVAPGGAMYLMVYSPEGMHNWPVVNKQRAIFHSLQSVDERLQFVKHVHDRRWDSRYRLVDNVVNQMVRQYQWAIGKRGNTMVGVLDALEPFYNWVIPLDVIDGWMEKAGFRSHDVMNLGRGRVAYHVLARK